MSNPLRALADHGQSVWLDYIRRSLITSGELQRLIEEDGLRGVTSNPSIFEKAVAASSDYAEALEAPEARALDAKALYEQLAVRDIQDAADALDRVYAETSKRDGYVSLEVSPFLAHDTPGTLAEARRLWRAVARDNLMIKIPATPEGVPAIRELVGEGVNVNVTLLFSLATYEQVADAYIAGVETFAANGGDPRRVASVASFFVSRIDTAIDALIDARLQERSEPRARATLRGLAGKAGIANAKLAYERYREIFSRRRWHALAERDAQTQRLLWASTGVKNPDYRDVAYVEELIGPDTVDTMPPATLDAFRDHGRARSSLTEDLDSARDAMRRLDAEGISVQEVTDKLLAEGVRAFLGCFCEPATRGRETSQGAWGRKNQSADARASHRACRHGRALVGAMARAGQGPKALGPGCIAVDRQGRSPLARLARNHQRRGRARRALHSRRGGCQERRVFRRTAARHGRIEPRPEVLANDLRQDRRLPQAARSRLHRPGTSEGTSRTGSISRRTLFIVSSKSGSTLEPNIFKAVLLRAGQRARRLGGGRAAGSSRSPIRARICRRVAERDGFRHVFFGVAELSAGATPRFRISAWSRGHHGSARLRSCWIGHGRRWSCACMPSVPVEENPGVVLGHGTRGGRERIRPRQDDHHRLAAHSRSRRLAGAIGR